VPIRLTPPSPSKLVEQHSAAFKSAADELSTRAQAIDEWLASLPAVVPCLVWIVDPTDSDPAVDPVQMLGLKVARHNGSWRVEYAEGRREQGKTVTTVPFAGLRGQNTEVKAKVLPLLDKLWAKLADALKSRTENIEAVLQVVVKEGK
jgi:hypothetical protein